MIMNGKPGETWEEIIVVRMTVLSQHLPVGMRESNSCCCCCCYFAGIQTGYPLNTSHTVV